jgi:hypothetical protein
MFGGCLGRICEPLSQVIRLPREFPLVVVILFPNLFARLSDVAHSFSTGGVKISVICEAECYCTRSPAYQRRDFSYLGITFVFDNIRVVKIEI